MRLGLVGRSCGRAHEPVRETCRTSKARLSGRGDVQQLHDGQCGLCVHFGETHPRTAQLINIRKQHEAPEVLLDECGHPRHVPLHLKVTPISGCDGFERALM